MFIETVPNRTSPPAVLLRESYRDEQGRAQKRTLANLSKLPDDVVDGLRALLRGGTVIGTRPDEMRIERSLPHGHVAAALGMLRRIALDRLILSTAKDAESRRHCDLVVAMIVDRLITPRSKLGFVRAVDQETATSSLGAVLRLGEVKEREAYEALDWLLERQQRIENGLARRHVPGVKPVVRPLRAIGSEGCSGSPSRASRTEGGPWQSIAKSLWHSMSRSGSTR